MKEPKTTAAILVLSISLLVVAFSSIRDADEHQRQIDKLDLLNRQQGIRWSKDYAESQGEVHRLKKQLEQLEQKGESE